LSPEEWHFEHFNYINKISKNVHLYFTFVFTLIIAPKAWAIEQDYVNRK